MSHTREADSAFVAEDLGPVAVPWTCSHRLHSDVIPQDFLIQVAWPPVPITPGQKYAVVYVLDGNHAFVPAVAIARAIQSGPFPLPPTIVVGVGYHFERPEDHGRWGILRVRDLSPCSDGLFKSQYAGGTAARGAQRRSWTSSRRR